LPQKSIIGFNHRWLDVVDDSTSSAARATR